MAREAQVLLEQQVVLRAQRDVLGDCLVRLGREYPDIIVLSPDVSRSTGALAFRQAYPARFL